MGYVKIFLDDYRRLNDNTFNRVRTYEDCIMLIDICGSDLEIIDLDYDLDSDKTGLDVLIYMDECEIRPERINIHSDHSEGAPEMRRFAEEHFPGSQVTMNRL